MTRGRALRIIVAGMAAILVGGWVWWALLAEPLAGDHLVGAAMLMTASIILAWDAGMLLGWWNEL